MFRPGTSEIVAGRVDRQRLPGRRRRRDAALRVSATGRSSACSTPAARGFDSEIWGDAEQMMQAFRRNAYSSVIFRLADPSGFDARARRALEADPRLTLEAKREQRVLRRAVGGAVEVHPLSSGLTLSVIFSIGAIIGAMITMYAAVASRTGEIGTLRALGFRRGAILVRVPRSRRCCSGCVGGVVGLAAASLDAGGVDLDDQLPDLRRARVLVHADAGDRRRSRWSFALAMGFVGGFLPAARAARLKIVDALRAA